MTSSDLQRELLPLRRSKRDILNVKLNRCIAALQIDRRLRSLSVVPILYLALFRGRAVAGRSERKGSSIRSPGQQGRGISGEVLKQRGVLRCSS